jgi:hypothetical protein
MYKMYTKIALCVNLQISYGYIHSVDLSYFYWPYYLISLLRYE